MVVISLFRLRRLLVLGCVAGGIVSALVDRCPADENLESEGFVFASDAVEDIDDVVYQPITLQPPAQEQPTLSQPTRPSPTRLARGRLARAPSMFGNFFAPSFQLITERESTGLQPPTINLALGSALRRTPLADNGKTLPTDRVFFLYNHYNNAVPLATPGPPGPPPGPPSPYRSSVDRYLLGLEKTLFSDWCSLEVRFPFSSPVDTRFIPDPASLDPAIVVPGQDYGNLNLIGKVLVHRSANFAAAIGVGVDLPTAGDVNGVIDVPPPGAASPGDLVNFRIHNDAVFLQPFVAVLATPTQGCFVQSFIQADIPTTGNAMTVFDPAVGSASAGRLTDTSLLHADIAFGHWLYQNPAAGFLQSIAGVVELHYITMLKDPDEVFVNAGPTVFGLANPYRRQDLLDLTAGLHIRLGDNTTVGIAGVAPLRKRPDQTSTGEVMVRVNHFFR